MDRQLTRYLFLAGLAISIIGFVINKNGNVISTVGSLVGLVAYIGALIRLAQLSRWGWFIGILPITFGIGYLAYLIAGPTTQKAGYQYQ
jgi:uncharacterized membrane protein YhhN